MACRLGGDSGPDKRCPGDRPENIGSLPGHIAAGTHQSQAANIPGGGGVVVVVVESTTYLADDDHQAQSDVAVGTWVIEIGGEKNEGSVIGFASLVTTCIMVSKTCGQTQAA